MNILEPLPREEEDPQYRVFFDEMKLIPSRPTEESSRALYEELLQCNQDVIDWWLSRCPEDAVIHDSLTTVSDGPSKVRLVPGTVVEQIIDHTTMRGYLRVARSFYTENPRALALLGKHRRNPSTQP